MQIVRRRAFARSGFIGNPSDGYHGRTISFVVRNFSAQVVIYEWEDVELIPTREDHSRFSSVRELVQDVEYHGYYGGLRLVKATIKKFVEFCDRFAYRLHERNFSIRYQTDIPRNVGLAGSSAIIVATLRCLMDFYEFEIDQEVLPSLALSVENEELGIAAGLQDRVVQVYEGLVYMDFTDEAMHARQGLDCGTYESLDTTYLPPVYLAYSSDVEETAQPTYVPHNNLRARFQAGDAQVLGAMQRLAELTVEARLSIVASDHARLAELVDENFDIRRSIYPNMLPRQLEMVERARSVGASAKFAGSGGAIVGTYRGNEMFEELKQALGPLRCHVIRPKIERDTFQGPR